MYFFFFLLRFSFTPVVGWVEEVVSVVPVVVVVVVVVVVADAAGSVLYKHSKIASVTSSTLWYCSCKGMSGRMEHKSLYALINNSVVIHVAVFTDLVP